MDRDEESPISVRLAMCPAERERDASGCRSSGVTPELSVLVATWCRFRRCCFRRRFVFRRWYWGCNVKHIAIAISWISRLRPLCWLRKSSGFYSCRRTYCPVCASSCVFLAPEAYRRGHKSGGYIAINLNKTHINSSRHN